MWSGNSPRRTESVTLRLTEAEEKHCSARGNRSEYIRYLIQQDMNGNIDQSKDVLAEKIRLEVEKKVKEEVSKILENLNAKPIEQRENKGVEREDKEPDKAQQSQITESIKNLMQF